MARIDSGSGINTDSAADLQLYVPTRRISTTVPTGPTVSQIAAETFSEFQNDALSETEEDLSFALAGRKSYLKQGKGDEQTVRARVMMQKLVAEVSTVNSADLDELLAGQESWQNAPDVIRELMARGREPGQAALQLAGWLARQHHQHPLRAKMAQALTTLMGDDDTAVGLFGALEFGVTTPALRQELVRAYQRAAIHRQTLSQWLKMLGERQNRKKKLRAMLRLLSYELSVSGQAVVGSHLAAVIGDLQQLLRILGLEEYCDDVARRVAIPTVTGEEILMCVVQLIEQIWINADGVRDQLPKVEEIYYYRLSDQVYKLIKRLPPACFTDPDHRQQLEEAIATLRERYADE